MKIVYSASDRIGAGLLLSRFLQNNSQHNIKIAGFSASTSHLATVDWTLDALYFNQAGEKFKSRSFRELINAPHAPKINVELAELLLEELELFSPDVVICDNEPVISHMSHFLGLKLWYYSPLHLLNGFNWSVGKLPKSVQITELKKQLSLLPKPEKYFIPGWFGQLSYLPSLKSNFYWLEPEFPKCGNSLQFINNNLIISNSYRAKKIKSFLKSLNSAEASLFDFLNEVKVNSEFCITTGEAMVVADLLFQGKYLCLTPGVKDVEALLQAQICKLYGLGVDLKQLELFEELAIERLEDCYFSVPLKNNNLFQRGVYPTLSQKVKELCNT